MSRKESANAITTAIKRESTGLTTIGQTRQVIPDELDAIIAAGNREPSAILGENDEQPAEEPTAAAPSPAAPHVAIADIEGDMVKPLLQVEAISDQDKYKPFEMPIELLTSSLPTISSFIADVPEAIPLEKWDGDNRPPMPGDLVVYWQSATGNHALMEGKIALVVEELFNNGQGIGVYAGVRFMAIMGGLYPILSMAPSPYPRLGYFSPLKIYPKPKVE